MYLLYQTNFKVGCIWSVWRRGVNTLQYFSQCLLFLLKSGHYNLVPPICKIMLVLRHGSQNKYIKAHIISNFHLMLPDWSIREGKTEQDMQHQKRNEVMQCKVWSCHRDGCKDIVCRDMLSCSLWSQRAMVKVAGIPTEIQTRRLPSANVAAVTTCWVT
jgi:hypothetical protein